MQDIKWLDAELHSGSLAMKKIGFLKILYPAEVRVNMELFVKISQNMAKKVVNWPN